MIGETVKALMLDSEEDFIIPAENVANVMYTNPLTHALLVLSQVKYSKIPVLGKGDRFVGLLSLSDIVDKMLDLNAINIEALQVCTVADVMEIGIPVVTEDWDLEDVLHLLVDNAFLPVVDENQTFKGIITRKEILKAVNRTLHLVERQNVLVPRVEESSKGTKVV